MHAHWMSRHAGLAMLALAWLWLVSFAASAQPADYPPAYAGDDPQSSFSELDRHGHWIEHAEWGTVWVPDVDEDWRPYTIGRWVFTDENGWYWDSEEPFGWAVFHYGRWLDDPDEGWIWVPGTEWGPAWVAWRYGDDAVGWAPLPPDAVWQPDRGLYLTDEIYHSATYAPFWIFVAPRYLLSSGLHRYVAPRGRNTAFFAHTRPSTRYGREGRNIFNHGIARHEIERLTRSRVPSLALMPSARPPAGRRSGSGAVLAYRPAIVPSNRWQAGRSGDWRRFEPAARPPATRSAPARIDRDFTPRRESGPQYPSRGVPDGRRDFDPRRGDNERRGTDIRRDNDARRGNDFGRDVDPRRDNDGGRLQRPYQQRAAPDRVAPDRFNPERAPPERRSLAPPPPAASQAPPRNFRQESVPQENRERSRDGGNQGGRMQRPEAAPQPRVQREVPAARQQPPQASPRRAAPPAQKPDEAPAGAPAQEGGRRRG